MKYLLFSFSVIALLACNNQKDVTQVIKAENLPQKPIANAPIEAPVKDGEIRTLESTANLQKAMQLDSLLISMERTGCFGTCPIYIVNIYKTGYAEYIGKNFVEKEGVYYTQFDKNYINAIYDKAVDISFFSLNNSYDNIGISDLPSTIVQLHDGNVIKKVLDRYDSPQALKDFEKLLDMVIDQQDWVKKDQ